MSTNRHKRHSLSNCTTSINISPNPMKKPVLMNRSKGMTNIKNCIEIVPKTFVNLVDITHAKYTNCNQDIQGLHKCIEHQRLFEKLQVMFQGETTEYQLKMIKSVVL